MSLVNLVFKKYIFTLVVLYLFIAKHNKYIYAFLKYVVHACTCMHVQRNVHILYMYKINIF